MNSSDASREWAAKYASVVQRLNAGAEEPAGKLVLADRNLARARRDLAAADPDGAIIAAEAAMVNAADAILARDGFRLRGKTASHEARLAFPGLPAEFGQETRMITAARRARNIALYDAPDRVPESMAADAIRVTEKLIAAARQALVPSTSS